MTDIEQIARNELDLAATWGGSHIECTYCALAKEVLRLQLILHAAEAQHSAKLRSGPQSAAYVEACLVTCAAVVEASNIIRTKQAPPC